MKLKLLSLVFIGILCSVNISKAQSIYTSTTGSSNEYVLKLDQSELKLGSWDNLKQIHLRIDDWVKSINKQKPDHLNSEKVIFSYENLTEVNINYSKLVGKCYVGLVFQQNGRDLFKPKYVIVVALTGDDRIYYPELITNRIGR